MKAEPPVSWESEHPTGCSYGGFSCGYWLIAEGCTEKHWERHIVLANGSCPCGTEYPGAANCAVVFDASSPDVPLTDTQGDPVASKSS